jgi:DNA-binding Lrp family transcriptional regulator
MPYEQKFSPEDILNVLDYTRPANVAYISSAVGCSRDTAKANLAQLERDGKVKRVECMGVKESLWVMCE